MASITDTRTLEELNEEYKKLHAELHELIDIKDKTSEHLLTGVIIFLEMSVLANTIEKKKEEIPEKQEEYKMELTVNRHNELQIELNDRLIFGVTKNGRFTTYFEEEDVEPFNKWLKQGAKCSEKVTIWRDGTYSIKNGTLERTDIRSGNIFTLSTFNVMPFCCDENIIRTCERTPIIF